MSNNANPRVLDLFCGAGGAAKGYHQCGYDVTGIDINPQPNYPFRFIQSDAIEYVAANWREYDIIHASPPCQAYAECGTNRKRMDHPDLIPIVRETLRLIGKPYIIENIPTAPMPDSFILCGIDFDLPIIRHRRFETSFDVVLPNTKCPQKSFNRSTWHGWQFWPFGTWNWENNWRLHVLPVVWPWMTLTESRQAIPPAYTEYIAKQLKEL